jgi:hypothetical protein
VAKDKRLYWTPTSQVRAGLTRIEALGLYGDTRSHIVNHIVTEEIKRLLTAQILTREALEAARQEALREFGPESEDDKTAGST